MRGVMLLCCLLLLAGCNKSNPESAKPDKTAATNKKPAISDQADAVEALTIAGAKLRKGKGGLVAEVSLRELTVDTDTLKALAELPRLRSVLLNNSSLTDAELAHLVPLKTVVNLDLRGCAISNAGLEHIAGMKQLRALRLSGENNKTTVDDQGMDAVARLTNLKALMLDFLWISQEGLAKLDGLKELEELYLKKALVDDGAMEVVVKQFPRLRKLRIAWTRVSDKGLKTLSQLPSLVELDLSENTVMSDAGLEYVGGMVELQKLNLWRCPITDDGIAHLAGLVKMKWLNLDNTSLADPGLESLMKMKQLEFLHLGSTSITDEGIPTLAGLTALRDLKLTRTAVTETAAATLGAKLPNTEIQLKYVE